MQLASIPSSVITANRAVATTLRSAHELTAAAQATVEGGSIDASVRSGLRSALDAAEQARAGAGHLGSSNLLDGTFHRYANHSVRELRDVVAMLDRPGTLGADSVKVFVDRLFDAEVSTRLGAEAGDRSLATPRLTALERESGAGGSDSASSGGPGWDDGEYLDELGNPARGGGDSWAGPDGERFGPDGSGGDGGSYVGPDGDSFPGI